MFVYFFSPLFSEVPTFQEKTKSLFGTLMDEGEFSSILLFTVVTSHPSPFILWWCGILIPMYNCLVICSSSLLCLWSILGYVFNATLGLQHDVFSKARAFYLALCQHSENCEKEDFFFSVVVAQWLVLIRFVHFFQAPFELMFTLSINKTCSCINF